MTFRVMMCYNIGREVTAMTYTERLFANGYLTEQDFVLALETLPTATQITRLPIYIVGITEFKGAEGVGAWVEDGILYLDPVVFFTDRETALGTAKKHEQAAIFKMTGILQETDVVCPKNDLEPLYEVLEQFSTIFGGATSLCIRKDDEHYIFRVYAGSGEVVFL
ncbi:MAG: hypothetical protein QXM12_07280 [Nitrososphaerota archaeon]